MANPIFSIVIPAYNAEHYIGETLESVVNQSFNDYEILVIDDGSEDHTARKIEKYIQKFNKHPLHLLRAPEKHLPGPGAVRNIGIHAARGEYIAFLDADDKWRKDHLEKAHHYFTQHPEVILYFAQAEFFDNATGEKQGIMGWGADQPIDLPFDAHKMLVKTNMVATSTVCARKQALLNVNGFEERLFTAQDWWLWICLSRHGKFFFHHQVEVDYRVSENSHTGGGDGVNPLLSGACFAAIARYSKQLQLDDAVALSDYMILRTSRILETHVRIMNIQVLMRIFRRMLSSSISEIWMWVRIWSHTFQALAKRLM